MMNICSDNLDFIYREIMRDLRTPEFESAPRGKPIREMLGYSFELMDPRARLISSPARETNYGFAVGELCWYVRGDTDLATMLYYNKRMAMFSDDGKTINSAYGARIFNERWQGTEDLTCVPAGQFDNVIQELKSDPDSRRAVMHINQPHDLRKAVTAGSKDVPCTLSLQLFIRERRLHMHATMRSNDVVWGLPYDVFSFTSLQELMLLRLQEAGVPVDDLGSYRHTAGSLHVYEPHYKMSAAISKETGQCAPPMKPWTLQSMEYLAEEMEPFIRQNLMTEPNMGGNYNDPTFDGTGPDDSALDWSLVQLYRHRDKRYAEEQERLRRQKALDELTTLTEELGLYDTKEKE